MKFRTSLAMSLIVLSVGCAEDTPTDKGAEENPLVGGKSDSFYRPSEHGNLRFGQPNQASFNDTQQFHAWEFELNGDAEVEIRTTIENKNLDTVLYLYHRQDESESWGRYLKKNDDYKDNLWSRINLGGEAGQYRVIVKTLKKAMRGGFGVNATCDGAGCPEKDTCDNTDFLSLPRTTDSSPQCVDDIYAVLTSPVVSESGGEVGIDVKCDATGIERVAVEYYYSWWEDIVGFDDNFRYDADEDVLINIYTTVHEAGTVVDLDAGGDEDGITFLFDVDDRLLAMYQHNQSPTSEFYCKRQGEISQTVPEPECLSSVLRLLPGDRVEVEAGEESVDDAKLISDAMRLAVDEFDNEFGVLGTDAIKYTMRAWDGNFEIDLTNDSGEATYVILDDYDTTLALKLGASSGSEFICE